MTLDELKAWNPPIQPYIIEDGILVPGTKAVLFGKYQTFKSMLTLHMAYTLNQGKPWFGYKTTKIHSYIVQSEIPQMQVKARSVKFADGNGSQSQGVWIATEPYLKLDKGFGSAELEKELVRTGAKLLIVDPMYKFISGRLTDEFDVRQLFDRLDLLIPKLNITIVVIHHPRKSMVVDGVEINMAGDDLYGAYLQNWADTIINVSATKMNDELQIRFDKARHSENIMPGFNFIVKVNRDNLTFARKK